MRPSRRQLAETLGKVLLGIKEGDPEWTPVNTICVHYSQKAASYTAEVTPDDFENSTVDITPLTGKWGSR